MTTPTTPRRSRRVLILAAVGFAALTVPVAAVAGQGDHPAAPVAAVSAPVSTLVASPSPASPTVPTPSHVPVVASVPTPSPAPVAASVPRALSCADVHGVFVAHGTDGRGDCMPADPRPACHVPPNQQDGNYLAELTMTPPFPGGTIDSPFLISGASNVGCWVRPAG